MSRRFVPTFLVKAVPRGLLAAGLLAVLGGCREAKIAHYRVPHENVEEPPAATGPGSDMTATAVPTAADGGLKWTAPAHWRAKPAGAMRKASFAVPGEGGEGDLSVTAFPGDVGGELANLNRWRNQLRLPPLAPADAAGAVTRFESHGLRFAVAEFVNTGGSAPVRMLGAIVPVGDNTWFFKLSGPDALVAREKAAFLAFLHTVEAPVAP
ncbi:MAG: hypothetical protein JSR48_11150 [Verrucomicrobia bacterium]|nr:hypothetical protein [Verrucomicrobiota bacterium]